MQVEHPKKLAMLEIKWVVQTMSPEKRETIGVKRHYGPRVSRLWRIKPHRYDPANDAQYHYRPQCFIDVRNQFAKKMKLKINGLT